jgi:hypothetical protein
MPQRESGSTKIAILGGDLMVGRTLEVVLRDVGYEARFHNGSLLKGSVTDEVTETLEDVRLVILAPRMSAEHRRTFLGRVRGTPATAAVPVLELVTASDTSPTGREEDLVGLVAWPCPTEELEREIEAALLPNGAAPKEQ